MTAPASAAAPAAAGQARPRLAAVPRPESRYETLPTRTPDPSPGFVGALALRAFEALEGTRPISQLGTAITWELAAHLGRVRAVRSERRQMFRDRRQAAAHLGRVVLCVPAEGVAEASVVLHTRHRTHAVAIRLEWMHAHWRATDLTVL